MTGARLRSLETDWLWATVSQVLVVEHDAQDPSCRTPIMTAGPEGGQVTANGFSELTSVG